MRKQAFTLLETMIALGIVVLALGAGATINRTLLIGGQVSEDSFHASQLADNAVEMVKGTQAYILNSTRADKTLSSYFGLTGLSTFAMIPYRSAANGAENNYLVSWCVDTGSFNACQNTTTKIGDGTRRIGQDFTDGGAETIAVSRATATGDFRNTVDYLTPLTPVNVTIPSFASCGTCTWDYYSRKTTLKKLSPTFLGAGAAVGSAYQLVVEVTNLRTRSTITRSVLLTDFGVSGNSGANHGTITPITPIVPDPEPNPVDVGGATPDPNPVDVGAITPEPIPVGTPVGPPVGPFGQPVGN